jgi:hydrogenase maturation protease
VLVLGLGNVLIEDEGVGIAALEYLRCYYDFDHNVELLDGGTSGMALLEDLRNRHTVIVLDAVSTGHAPGELVMLENAAVPAFLNNRVSPHQLALSDVLAILRFSDEQPEYIAVIGVEPVSLKTRIGLSPRVRAQVESMAAEVLKKIAASGYAVAKNPPGMQHASGSPFNLI